MKKDTLSHGWAINILFNYFMTIKILDYLGKAKPFIKVSYMN